MAMRNVTVTLVTATEAATNPAAFLESWSNQYSGYWGLRFQRLLRPGAGTVWCALASDSDSRIIAALHVEVPQAGVPLAVHWTWISNVWVAPDYRRQGTARAMIEPILSDPRIPAGTWALATHHLHDDPAKNLYVAMGFRFLRAKSNVMVRSKPVNHVAETFSVALD